jgi:Flavin containing amine oxidoreductase
MGSATAATIGWGCYSAVQLAPRRTAVLGRLRVERRARGARSSVMASRSAGCWETLAAAALGVARAPRAVAARDASVVVIGAGLGGLACTYRLHRHGVPATLYEAQERLGGRCFSIRSFFNAGQTAEHGGQYIDSRHRHIRSLAKELGIPLVDTFEQSFPAGSLDPLWLDGGLQDPAEVFADLGLFMDRLRADYRRVGRYFYDQAGPEAVAFDHMTMTEWFQANLPGGAGSLLGRALGAFMQGFFGLEPDDMSAINLFEAFVFPYPGADERLRVAGGNDMIVQGLRDALPAEAIRTGHALAMRCRRPPMSGWRPPRPRRSRSGGCGYSPAGWGLGASSPRRGASRWPTPASWWGCSAPGT